jgi:hypothetical protein
MVPAPEESPPAGRVHPIKHTALEACTYTRRRDGRHTALASAPRSLGATCTAARSPPTPLAPREMGRVDRSWRDGPKGTVRPRWVTGGRDSGKALVLCGEPIDRRLELSQHNRAEASSARLKTHARTHAAPLAPSGGERRRQHGGLCAPQRHARYCSALTSAAAAPAPAVGHRTCPVRRRSVGRREGEGQDRPGCVRASEQARAAAHRDCHACAV